MKSFTVLDGVVAPMDRANVDTDLIIPKQFLKSIKRSPVAFIAFAIMDYWRTRGGQKTSGGLERC